MIECVIFDVDGTLLDTEKEIIESLQRIVKEELGQEPAKEELTFSLGIPGSVALERLGIKNVEEVCERWDSYAAEEVKEFILYSGMEETLAELRQRGVQVGVVTSRSKAEVNNAFAPLGLMKYMEHIVCCDDTTKYKPDPEPILKYLELSSIDPLNVLYIGDTIYDKECAQGAGVKFALALWGAKYPEKIGGDYLLELPSDILNLLI